MLNSWLSAWSALGVERSSALVSIHAELISRYSEPHRHYHTMQHLGECFERLRELKVFIPHPAEVEIALWFHDAIYDTRKTDNEALSAQWAADVALSLGASKASAALLQNLVMATQHKAEPIGPDAQALVDVDLSILGASVERFAEYEQQIRQEYAWVPESMFKSKRAAVLKQFLEKPHIYCTPLFRQRYEARARTNLEYSLSMLGQA